MTAFRRPLTMAALSLLMTAAACADPSALDSDGVSARLRSGGIEVFNGRTQTIYTFMVDRELLPLINWAPCADPGTCAGIAPGQRRVVPGDEIAGWDAADELVVFWWHLVPAEAGGFQPDSIRSAVLRL